MLIDISYSSGFKRIETSTEKENTAMQNLLSLCGFSTDGEIREKEIVYYLRKC